MRRIVRVSSICRAIAIGGTALVCGHAGGQEYPAKPIRIVVPFSSGGGVDTLGRLVGQRLSEQFGVPFVVQNRPGAGGTVATGYVASANADGYTMMIGANGLAANPSLYRNLPFDMERDFTGVAFVGASPLILVAGMQFGPSTVPALIAYAKDRAGKGTYATGGSGTSGHLAAELFKLAARIDLRHVAYKGGTQAFVDLQAGRVDVMFIDPPLAMPQIKANRMKALAVGSAKRFWLLPSVPTVSEAGLQNFDARVWWGFVAPAKVPASLVARLNTEINRAIAHPSVGDRLKDMGVETAPLSAQEFGRFLAAETAKWATVIKQANIQAN